jgi:nucleoid-associated protein YgaU
MLAVRYYGPGYERLWWVIMQANNIIDPSAEMYPGQRLLIPPRASVLRFIARAGDAVT